MRRWRTLRSNVDTDLKEGTGNPWAGQGMENPVPSCLTMATPCSPETFGDSLDSGSNARKCQEVALRESSRLVCL